MKKIYLSLLLVLGIVVLSNTNAKAQLENGSIAPDWTLTDINGVQWNLYTLLDEGKSVFLDFSAVWCGPCWSYHNTGNLETLYEDYGPDGTNEVMVFYIEGDGASTMDELNGIGAGTQGDWVSGTGYPIILTHAGDPSYAVVSDYEIAYFPTIYRVCQNRIIEEVGQVSTAVLYASIDDCASASVNVDPSILTYDGPVIGCSEVDLEITIQNMGFDPLTACTITAFEGATEIASVDWTGNLTTYQIDNVNLGTVALTDASTDIEIRITSADDNDLNNSIETTITYEDDVTVVIHLEVKTDDYPTETRWELIDESTGDVIAEDGPYSNGDKNEIVYDEDITLNGIGCYTFTCYDAYGDGLLGAAYYKIFAADGGLITSGGENVGFEKSDALKVNDETAIEDIAALNGVSLYPNPANTSFTFDINMNQTAEVAISVVDMYGKVIANIANSALVAGTHSFEVSTENMANGIYFVRMTEGGNNAAVKFTVFH